MRLIVKEVAQREGIASAYELSMKTGIHVTSIYKIWNGKARMIGLDTLDRLCTVLNVKPGQLFEHEAEPEKLPGGSESTAMSASSTRRTGPGGKPKREPRKAAALAVGV
jgi:DNA-binding Xre family transcriptional regulator